MNSLLGWLSSLWGTITGIPQDVIRAFSNAINTVQQWGEDAYNYLLGLWHNAESDIGNVASWASNALTSTWNGLSSWAISNFNKVYDWVGSVVQDARNFASGLVNDALNQASHWVNDLTSFVDSIPSWVNANVFQPLLGLYHDALGFVTNTVIPWVTSGLNDIRSFFGNLINVVSGVASSAWNMVTRFWSDIWPVLDACWHFLVFVAEHPFDWWMHYLNQGIALSPDHIASLIEGVISSDTGHLEEVMSQWLRI